MEANTRTTIDVAYFAAKTNGIRDTAGVWYNPQGQAVQYTNQTLVGKKVELTMTGHGNDFSFIKVTGEATTASQPRPTTPNNQYAQSGASPVVTKDDYWLRRESRDKEKDLQISRHGALNTAIAALGPIKKLTTSNMNQYLISATYLADQVLRYVNNDQNLQSEIIEKASQFSDADDIPEETVN